MLAAQSFRSKTARRAVIFATAAAGVLLAGACSSSYRSTLQPGPSPAVTVAAGSSPLGPVAVDAAGRTLYRFDPDQPGSGSSACNGSCAITWPPAVVGGQLTAGPGVSGSLTLIPRIDGTHQVALDGHPLYRYSGDSKPGDTAGDGFGGIWHVVHTDASSSSTMPAHPSGY
jgi:predicted lipoprotein with Yx(FWY)xxD motif